MHGKQMKQTSVPSPAFPKQQPKMPAAQNKQNSAASFLKPNQPNLFQDSPKADPSAHGQISQSVQLQERAASSNAPVQRKLIFRGEECKRGNFLTKYWANKDYLDQYTDKDNQVNRISEKSVAEPGGNQTDKVNSFVGKLISSTDDNYIGVRDHIVDALVDICLQIRGHLPALGEQKDAPLVSTAIARMYAMTNKDELLSNKNKKTYYQGLIKLVNEKLPDHQDTPRKSEYKLENGRVSGTDADSKRITDASGNEYKMTYGEYMYRSMSKEEMDDLIAHSTEMESGSGRYQFKQTDIANPHIKINIGTHVGNITQAATYSGYLVCFKMKKSFNDVIHNEIRDGEGSRADKKIGLKFENEGTYLNSANQKGFSFYIPGRESKTFLANVKEFQVLNLGKVPREHA